MIGGFRIERRLPPGSLGAVYEATQISLDRRVALRLIPAEQLAAGGLAERLDGQQRVAAAIHHRGLVPTYEAGAWEGGRFVATRFVRGRTLAELTTRRAIDPDRRAAIVEQVAGALAAAHGAGLAHGAVNARNVIVEASGDALLADLGIGRDGSPEEDRRALEGLAAAGSPKRSRMRRVAIAAAAAAAAAVVAIALGGGDVDAAAIPPPAVTAGTEPLGSGLAPGPVSRVGCADAPSANTPACTIGQETLEGRPAETAAGGAIRAWAVRGATGDLALQVIATRGKRQFLSGFSQTETVTDDGPHLFATDVPVRRGDRIAVLLSPGAEVGLRSDTTGAAAERWEGNVAFAPLRLTAAPIEGEVMLRADVDPGARPRLQQITGRRAAALAAGEVVDQQPVGAPSGASARVALVSVGGGLAIDSFRGKLRRARVEVPDLDPSGRLLDFDGFCGFAHGFCLRWINPGEENPANHAYRVTAAGAFRLIG